MKVTYDQMKTEVKRAMIAAGLTDSQAEVCATVHTQSSQDGVYSHGLNRVPRFISYLKDGLVDPNGTPQLVHSVGCAENYDGQMGIGILNAKFCTDRAIKLAEAHGIGLVTLKNTTHWMRGGTYAWDAANAGYLSICWTNTESCMPLWGSTQASVGNNPLCIGIPSDQGHLVLDMAMSLYSYGKLQVTRLAGDSLPYPGGFDTDGNLTSDPGKIEESMRILPAGYWKGSGLATMLDLAGAILSNGNSAGVIDQIDKGSCGSCSQIFMVFNPYLFGNKAEIEEKIKNAIAHIHGATPVTPGKPPSYPGERTAATRAKNKAEGIPVDPTVWAEVCSL